MAKLCIALDTEFERAREFVKAVRGYPVIFKVGYKLFISHHRAITDLIKEEGFELFLDLKLHDIPNTVRNGVLSCQELGADYLTIHAFSGREAIRSAVEVKGNVKLLGVSILTSINENFLKGLGLSLPIQELVFRLASMVVEEGFDGVVCSGKEVELLKKTIKRDFIAVVPGISLTKNVRDHARSVSLEEALQRGADIVVIGRDILEDKDPIKKTEEVLLYVSQKDNTLS